MVRLTFVLLCLITLPLAVSAESDNWKETIHSASKAHDRCYYQQAKKLFRQAVEKADDFPAGDLRRAETKIQLAGTLLELGEYRECEQLCLKAIEFLGKHHPEENSQLAQANSVLTRLYLSLRLVRLAEKYCENGLGILEDAQGKERLDLAELHAFMRLLWNVKSSGGDSSGGRKASEILYSNTEEYDPRWIIVYQALAGDCYERWQPAQAKRAVSIAETVYGTQHPRYAECLSTLATSHRHKEEYEQSKNISLQVIEILSKSLGPDHPKLAASHRNLATIKQSRGHSAQAAKHLRESIRLRFATLSDVDLCYFFDRVRETELISTYGEREIPEMYLTEMARRGGDVFEDYLTGIVNEMRRNRLKAKRSLEQLENSPVDNDMLWTKLLDRLELKSDNLEVLTALRRVQKKPDPLKIFVGGSDKITCEFPDFPTLDVTIRNVDVSKREVGFTESGNYRSGRQARWRIEVTDAKGRLYGPKSSTSWIAGGISLPTTLKAGEGWQTSLAMESFVQTLPPGEYQMRILYHNQITIVYEEFTEGLIVSRSDPIKLIVKSPQITVTKKQQQTIDDILKRFDDNQPVKVVAGTYGEWVHDFVKPDSQYGRLLALNWSAVPSLIEDLQRETHSPQRRAHLLALLYSITAEHDPVESIFVRSSALGTFSRLSGGWYIEGKREGEQDGSASFGTVSGPAQYEGKLIPKAQEPFIRKWQTFSQHLKVVRED